MGNSNEKKRAIPGVFLLKIVSIMPVAFWMILFVVVPLFYVFMMSFMARGLYGGVEPGFSLENYLMVFQAEYLKIYGTSLFSALMTTIICLIIAYPFTLFIVQKSKITRTIFMALIIIPSVVNSLVRLFGWVTLLRKTGVVNSILLKLGLIKEPLELIYNHTGVIIGLVYLLLMFMILPLFNSMEKIDYSLIEAAYDLGSRRKDVILKIIFPLTKPGIFAGSIMVFIPSLGYFFVSDILGGGTSLTMGNLIKNQFMVARNWPLGAAISIMLIIITLLILYIYEKRGGNMADLGGR
ncbi:MULTISPECIES: ABC transporter permease [unclassified Enterococcus]|uniref:ABC transporter permease n=1 Tax=unclassified Enterococcus TaxID=2608891 RepID=UPI001554416A|nr:MULTISPECIES: ABC transporter permease [unclassified Enterococcus]MBS7576766.1 ABC transporter permease [Enterococcus sp. MMGLQ5-2]MBS7583747.1 ABC transporter permease [Enterococcus sp. MMGLQ5-1]NPD11608.1 ABC transporter permease [Enterococcus sp. MMGLQ5-1]NPD36603.1 ABC transporter permease [Enterococcus sp. MMGLQ5-2]